MSFPKLTRHPLRARRAALRPAPLVAVVLLCMLANVAGAQRSRAADAAELKGYRLTMPKVEAWAKASVAIAEAMKAKVASGDTVSDDADEGESAGSLDDVAARLQREPTVRRALRSAGISAREYSIVGLVLMQAMMAEAMMRQNPTVKLGEVNPANVQFVKTNRARLEERLRAVKAAAASE
jgi:hypothetical protein